MGVVCCDSTVIREVHSGLAKGRIMDVGVCGGLCGSLVGISFAIEL